MHIAGMRSAGDGRRVWVLHRAGHDGPVGQFAIDPVAAVTTMRRPQGALAQLVRAAES